MPPKKKQRLSPPSEATPSVAATPGDVSTKRDESAAPSPDPVNDPWTDEQEIALFKGVIRWKPVGMHKHFRMLSVAHYLHSHGHEAPHTRIPGIWAKLHSLYNLAALDEREDSYGDSLLRDASTLSGSSAATPSSNAENESQTSSQRDGAGDGAKGRSRTPWYAFQLPDEPDFNARMFDRRLVRDGNEESPRSSPPLLRHQLGTSEEQRTVAERYSVADTEDFRGSRSPRASSGTPATSRPGRGGATARGRGGATKADAAIVRKGSRLKEESTPRSGRGRGKKQESTEVEEEEKGDEEDEESEEVSEGEGAEVESERGTPKTRAAQTRGRGRGRRGNRRGGRRR